LADSIGAHAIVVTSRTGRLVEAVASFRPKTAIIYGCTEDEGIRRKLWAVRSVVPLVIEFTADPQKTVDNAMAELKRRNRLLPGDQVVVVSDVHSGGERIESVQVHTFLPA
ncbi:MAG TPA: pyruvate kinase alpha/beta domain-containing protein, partial [Polyangiaceae bacterium]|nr:pyruvate kinase alpha/beta domain-containing protein [Polyangiaceae bacterium]